MLRRTVRLCEECGTERRITLLEQAVTTDDGELVMGLFGEGRCECPSYALDELDLAALGDPQSPSIESDESEDLDLEIRRLLAGLPPDDEEPPAGKNKKPRSKS